MQLTLLYNVALTKDTYNSKQNLLSFKDKDNNRYIWLTKSTGKLFSKLEVGQTYNLSFITETLSEHDFRIINVKEIDSETF